MRQLFIGIIIIYSIVSVLRYVFKLNIINQTVPYTRYLYVVLHELSHALVGLLTGCGIQRIVLKTEGDSAGYYQPKYESRLRFLWMNIGGALTALAGPLLPPIIIYWVMVQMTTANYSVLIIVTIIALLLIIRYSPQRWLYVLVIGGLYGLTVVTSTQLVNTLILVGVVWMLLGFIDEIFIVGGYNRKGSDMGVAVNNLFKVDWPAISWLLNKGVQGYYIYTIYKVMTLLMTV